MSRSNPPSFRQHINKKYASMSIANEGYLAYLKTEGHPPANAPLLMNFCRKSGPPLSRIIYSDAHNIITNPPKINYTQNPHYNNKVMTNIKHVKHEKNMKISVESKQFDMKTNDDNTDWKAQYEQLSIAYQDASFQIFSLTKENRELHNTIQTLSQTKTQSFSDYKSAPIPNKQKQSDTRNVTIIRRQSGSGYKQTFNDDYKDEFAGGRQRSKSNPYIFGNLNDFDCMICLESKSAEYQHIISTCGHQFCRDCLRGHILNYAKPELPTCPLPKCNSQLADHIDIQILVTETEYTRLHDKIDKIGISKLANLKQCLTPDCTYAVELIGGTKFDCAVCSRHWCTECQVEWHSGMTCDDYKESVRRKRIRNNAQQRDRQYNDWKQNQGSGVKQCPSCNNHVQKNGGCNHITCRCGTHWCWICVAVINAHNLEAHFSQNHPMF